MVVSESAETTFFSSADQCFPLSHYASNGGTQVSAVIFRA